MLSNLYRHFLVSPIYVIEGIGSVFLNPTEYSADKVVYDPQAKYIKGSSEDLIRELEENIATSSALLAQLKMKLKATQDDN